MILHPGAAVALRRVSADELGIARMMAAGELASPQRYHNVSLYNVRVTGTGVSYRPQLEEFVYRRPENYLTQEFLDRCNGLPVIVKHPNKNLLDHDEFVERIAGTVFLPYLKDDEVWAICKLFDKDAIASMDDEQMSTSPAVLLGDGSRKLQMEDGTKLLVEGKPILLDHLAIVSKGVWDKGGDATGVEFHAIGDSAMTKEEEAKAKDDAAKADKAKADAARADADKRMDEKLDQMLSGVDSLRKDMVECNKRMDGIEEMNKAKEAKGDAKKDGGEEDEDTKAKRLVADKAKKDSDDEEAKKKADAEEEEKKKADAVRADSVDFFKTELKKRDDQIAALAARIPAAVTDADHNTLVAFQSRADDVFTKHAERAPRPQMGETAGVYRRRVAGLLQKHSDKWKGIGLDAMPDDAFETIETMVYADATERARHPNNLTAGSIREHTYDSGSGHKITEFYGAPDVHFVKAFSRNTRRVKNIVVPH